MADRRTGGQAVRVRRLLIGAALALTLPSVALAQQAPNVRFLVYTKNGQGYVHENIPFAVRGLQRLGAELHMTVDTSSDPTVFTEANLRRYAFLVFANTNNDVFDNDAQRLVFRRYIEAGGGMIGIHSVLGTERNWTWFKQLMGGTFNWHAVYQPFRVRRIDAAHASVQGVPDDWRKSDEFYFVKEMYPGIQVILASDIRSLGPQDSAHIREAQYPFADYYPSAWTHEFDGGFAWITTLGHDGGDYENPIYSGLLRGALRYAATRARPLDYRRAYATSRDTPLP